MSALNPARMFATTGGPKYPISTSIVHGRRLSIFPGRCSKVLGPIITFCLFFILAYINLSNVQFVHVKLGLLLWDGKFIGEYWMGMMANPLLNPMLYIYLCLLSVEGNFVFPIQRFLSYGKNGGRMFLLFDVFFFCWTSM